MMRWFAFGFGAAVGIFVLDLIGREALANEQAAMWERKARQAFRDANWKALKR